MSVMVSHDRQLKMFFRQLVPTNNKGHQILRSPHQRWHHDMHTLSPLLYRCAWKSISSVYLTQSIAWLLADCLTAQSSWQQDDYGDVIMGAIASQITSLTIVYSTVYSDADQGKNQSSASLALCGEFTGDRWIPRTNGQWRRKCFHLMTSSCIIIALNYWPFVWGGESMGDIAHKSIPRAKARQCMFGACHGAIMIWMCAKYPFFVLGKWRSLFPWWI